LLPVNAIDRTAKRAKGFSIQRQKSAGDHPNRVAVNVKALNNNRHATRAGSVDRNPGSGAIQVMKIRIRFWIQIVASRSVANEKKSNSH
jgi:hypothetical protein